MEQLTQFDPVQIFAIVAILFALVVLFFIARNFDKQFDNHDDQTFI